MLVTAKSSVRVAPRKIRLVADSIRKLSVDDALSTLSVLDKRAAVPLQKTIKSAVANATNNAKVAKEDLKLKAIEVLEAPSYKRYHPSTRGRIHPYKRRGSHIKVILEAKEEKSTVQNVEKKGEKGGTKS